MKKHFLEAFKIINSNITFVIILSLSNVFYANHILFIFLPLAAAIILYPGIFGYFIGIIRHKKNEIPFSENIRKYSIKFLYVNLVVFSPAIIYSMLIPGGENILLNKVLGEILRTTLQALTLYVIPIVFIKETKLEAIPLGIKFLLRYFRHSLPLIMLSLLLTIIKILYFLFILHFGSLGFPLIISIGYISALISTYVVIIQFLVASMFLLETANGVKS